LIIIVLFYSIVGYAQQATTYDEAIMIGDELMSENKILDAKAYYQIALSFSPDDEYSNKQIVEIVGKLNSPTYKEDRYLEIIDIADNSFKKYKFDDALDGYLKALEIIPHDGYAQGKVNRIKEIQRNQNENSEDFNQFMSEGVTQLENNKFIDAIKSFKQAAKIFPDNNEPRIYIANTKAVKINYDNKIATYTNEIELADSYIEAEDYVEALVHLDKAVEISPNDWAVKNEIKNYKPLAEKQLRNNKVIEVEDILSESQLVTQDTIYSKSTESPDNRIVEQITLTTVESQNNTSLNLVAENRYQQPIMADIENIIKQNKIQIETQYSTRINNGDSLLSIGLFDESIVAFKKALVIKPQDSLAQKRIAQAKSEKVIYETAIALQKAYEESIAKADSLFTEKNYSQSNLYFEKALNMKPDEVYPSTRVQEIRIILAKIEAETNQKYDKAISIADKYYDARNLTEAVVQYNIASVLKPNESYPKDKIIEINTLIEETLRKVRNKYDVEIATADKLYAVKIYDKAIVSYRKAALIIPDESYPQEMVSKIIKLMEENAIVDILSHNITIHSDTTKRFTFEPVSVNVRRSNYLFLKATNLSGNAYKLIVSYGSDKGKNGGFVVQVPEGGERNDYIIRVGNQYKWFADNNNWISIQPEKGDIEISLIRISKSD